MENDNSGDLAHINVEYGKPKLFQLDEDGNFVICDKWANKKGHIMIAVMGAIVGPIICFLIAVIAILVNVINNAFFTSVWDDFYIAIILASVFGGGGVILMAVGITVTIYLCVRKEPDYELYTFNLKEKAFHFQDFDDHKVKKETLVRFDRILSFERKDTPRTVTYEDDDGHTRTQKTVDREILMYYKGEGDKRTDLKVMNYKKSALETLQNYWKYLQTQLADYLKFQV